MTIRAVSSRFPMRTVSMTECSAGPHRPDAADAPETVERQTYDYTRHGTTTPFAAQESPPARSSTRRMVS
jgi:hypothetical protein